MAKVLVIGLGPLLRPGVRHLGGQCLRTWHFTGPMREAGHDVTLVTTPVAAEHEAAMNEEPIEWLENDGQPYAHFTTRSQERQQRWLAQLLAGQVLWKSKFANTLTNGDPRFDAIVAVNTYPAMLVAALPTRLPVWSDLNGWVMAEAQTIAQRDQSEDILRWAWRQEKAAIWRADRLSVVSQGQRHATYGELASLGRLGLSTNDPSWITVVPNACAPQHVAVGVEMLARLARGETASITVDDAPPGARWALWSGGFNTWTDIDALTTGLEKALSEEPLLHLAVTGGAIDAYHEAGYEAFKKWREASAHRERVRLLGWLPTEEMLAWYARADVGLNFDARTLEVEFGARNRLTNMAASGLAIVSSRGAEVADELEEDNAGYFFPTGSAEGLARALYAAIHDRDLTGMRVRAHRAAITRYTDARTIAPLLEWLNSPKLAWDNAQRQASVPHGNEWQHHPINDHQRHESLWLHESADGMRADSDNLRRLRSKWPLRVWRSLKRAIGKG